MKKILIAEQLYPVEIGGPNTYAEVLQYGLMEEGFTADIFHLSDVAELPWGLKDYIYARRLKRLAKDYDIIYAQDTVRVGLPAMKVAKSLGKKFLLKVDGDYAWQEGVLNFGVTDHPEYFSSKPSGYGFVVDKLKKTQKQVAQNADLIIVPNQFLKKLVINWGISEEKIEVVHNGFTPVDSGVLSLEEGESSDLILVSAGRLMPWRDLSLLIKIVFELSSKYSNIKFYIYGDGPEKKNLEALIEKYNLSSRVFLLGEVSHEELVKHIHYADMFIAHDAYGADFSVLLEAMSAGTVVVTTDTGSHPELIGDGHNGLLASFIIS